MTSPESHITEQETPPRRLTPLACLYVPVIMALAGLARFAVRAGIIRFEPPRTEAPYILGIFRNRYFRRAQEACIRKEMRLMARTGRAPLRLTYFPRRLEFLPYIELAECKGSVGRFMENYARDSGVSRAQVFGLSGAYYIASVIEALLGQASEMLSGVTARLSLATPSDPAPP